jgi:hypothetical protein
MLGKVFTVLFGLATTLISFFFKRKEIKDANRVTEVIKERNTLDLKVTAADILKKADERVAEKEKANEKVEPKGDGNAKVKLDLSGWRGE